MNIGAAFPSKYIRAADLGQARPVVIISGVTMEEIGDDEPKPVLHFQGKSKTLVLNKTNANMITEIVGSPETERWNGQRIVLYASKTDFGGKRVDCIRVDYPPKVAPAAALPPPPVTTAPVSEFVDHEDFVPGDDDVPF